MGAASTPITWAVVLFPGSNCDQDCVHAVRDVLHDRVIEVWHRDEIPAEAQAILIPGGFSYGDYLRTGALAALSPVMQSVRRRAEMGTPILGICNGFQVLTEARLLPGALLKNTGMRFRCMDQPLRVEADGLAFTGSFLKKGDVITLPIAHGYGNYFVPAEQRAEIEPLVVLRYSDPEGNVSAASNPNGSLDNIAAVRNRAGNVMGLMPHPERAVEPMIGGTDGLKILRAMRESVLRPTAAASGRN